MYINANGNKNQIRAAVSVMYYTLRERERKKNKINPCKNVKKEE